MKGASGCIKSGDANTYGGSSYSNPEVPELRWTEPQYSKSRVDRAGISLAKHYTSKRQDWMGLPVSLLNYDAELDDALEVINNWRSSHYFPLNAIQMGLRTHAFAVDDGALVAQRIKRLPSIALKLRIEKDMKLSRMQDIGGCRAVVADIDKVRQVRQRYSERRTNHRLVREKDYIIKPKTTGYRGVHLIYRYCSERHSIYNDHQIEIQVRSRMQHVWATAVETVGTLIQQSLKSNQGEERWRRFFQLMGSWMAMQEDAPLVPQTPTSEKDLLDELRQSANDLQVSKKLMAYRSAIHFIGKHMPGSQYYLLAFYPDRGVNVSAFSKRDFVNAMKMYLSTEKRLSEAVSGSEVVLVSVDSFNTLQRAYPSYFTDTDEFLKLLNKALS